MDEIPTLFLHNHNIFKDLIPQELDIVKKFLKMTEADTGQVIFKQGSAAESMCLVLSGELEVMKTAKDGSLVKIATIGDGQSVGEMALVDGMVRSATVRASMLTTIVVLKRDQFDEILRQYPRIAAKLMKGIARHISINLRKTSDQLMSLMMPMT
ncbi:MAG: cyclic nucleotide-binding domain-containing protein [Gammaproteobacteria bacterium]|nr:cyclic nucleotide-binding domain-containing protein [Gammaproteobacteria bacterium]